LTDRINKIPQGPSDGNAVYFVSVTRNVNGTPTDIYVPTNYVADMPSYVATIPNIALGANKNIASLVNKTGTTKTVRILHIYAVPALAAAIAGLQVTLEVHGITGADPTGGTVVPIRNHDTDDGGLPAQIEVRNNPTSTPLANWILASGVVNNEETASKESQQTIFKKEGNISALILRANQGILVKQTALAGAGNINLHIVFQVD
jgi:hypothetical protein